MRGRGANQLTVDLQDICDDTNGPEDRKRKTVLIELVFPLTVTAHEKWAPWYVAEASIHG